MKFEGLRPFLGRYLNSWVILGIDLTVSFIASVVALALISLSDRTLLASVSLPIVWLGSSVVVSSISFYLTGTYRSVIRHTTLREIGKLFSAVVSKELLMLVLMLVLPWLVGLRNLPAFKSVLLFSILKQDALSALSGIREKEADVIFMDPPYHCGYERQVLQVLAGAPYVTEHTLIVIEAALTTDFSYLDELGFSVTKEKCYKTNKHIFCRKK